MSAFAVSKLTIDRAVTAIMAHDGFQCDFSRLVPSENADAQGRRLMEMNRAALLARYGVYAADDITDAEIAAYRHETRREDDRVLWQAMRCLRYQCSEGNVPETFTEYKILNDAIQRLSSAIIDALPKDEAYEKAWQ